MWLLNLTCSPGEGVDIVIDNHGAPGTADKAMHAIRPGGVYLLIPHGWCFYSRSQRPPCSAKEPKKGVRQINFNTPAHIENSTEALLALDEMRDFFEAGKLVPHVQHVYSLSEIRAAYAASAGGHIVGKIAVSPSLTRPKPIVI